MKPQITISRELYNNLMEDSKLYIQTSKDFLRAIEIIKLFDKNVSPEIRQIVRNAAREESTDVWSG